MRWVLVSGVVAVLASCGPSLGDKGGEGGGSSGESDTGAPATARQLWSVVGRCGTGKDVALFTDGRIAVVGEGYVDDDTTGQSVGYVQLYDEVGEELLDLSIVEPALSPNAVAVGPGDEIVAVGNAHALALDTNGDPVAAIDPVLYEDGELELVDVKLGQSGELWLLGNAHSLLDPSTYAVWLGSWSLDDTLDTEVTLATGESPFYPTAAALVATPERIAVCGYEWSGEATTVWTAAYDDELEPLWSDEVAGSDFSAYQRCNAVTQWGDGLLSAGQVEPEGGVLLAYDPSGAPLATKPVLPDAEDGLLVQVVDLATAGTTLAVAGRDAEYPSTGRRSWIRWHDQAQALVAEVEATEADPTVPDAAPDIRAIAMNDAGEVVAIGMLETGDGDGCTTRSWLGKFAME